MQEILIEWLKGSARVFLHPILYLSIISAIAIGYFRVKRERRDFNTRLLDGYHDLRVMASQGILIGLLFSIPLLISGVVIPFAAIALIAIISIIFVLRVSFLSTAFTVGFTYFILVVTDLFKWELPFFNQYVEELNIGLLSSIVILLGTLLLIEGILIFRNGWKQTSPLLIKSPRGLIVGALKSEKLWLVPLFFLLPTGTLELPFEWWPVFTIGTESYSIILVPFIIGFKQLIRSTLPTIAVKNIGTKVMWLGALTLTLAISGYWAPYFSIIGAVVAILGRAYIAYRHRTDESGKPYYYSKQPRGIMILGVLPDSPAKKLALTVGEIIIKVNSIDVNSEREFYEALQKNRAYCKLEVIGTNGENRFAQGALYEGDHHELGIIFADESKQNARHLVS